MTELDWLKKFAMPASKWSTLERRRILDGLQTGYQWWWQKHPLSGKPILTYVHPATGLKVLPDQEWYQQDFSNFGRVYNFDKTFFAQFRELQIQVPLLATRNLIDPENSVAMSSQGDINSFFSYYSSNINYIKYNLLATSKVAAILMILASFIPLMLYTKKINK